MQELLFQNKQLYFPRIKDMYNFNKLMGCHQDIWPKALCFRGQAIGLAVLQEKWNSLSNLLLCKKLYSET